MLIWWVYRNRTEFQKVCLVCSHSWIICLAQITHLTCLAHLVPPPDLWLIHEPDSSVLKSLWSYTGGWICAPNAPVICSVCPTRIWLLRTNIVHQYMVISHLDLLSWECGEPSSDWMLSWWVSHIGRFGQLKFLFTLVRKYMRGISLKLNKIQIE